MSAPVASLSAPPSSTYMRPICAVCAVCCAAAAAALGCLSEVGKDDDAGQASDHSGDRSDCTLGYSRLLRSRKADIKDIAAWCQHRVLHDGGTSAAASHITAITCLHSALAPAVVNGSTHRSQTIPLALCTRSHLARLHVVRHKAALGCIALRAAVVSGHVLKGCGVAVNVAAVCARIAYARGASVGRGDAGGSVGACGRNRSVVR